MASWRLLLVSEPGLDGVFSCVRILVQHLHAHHPEIEVDFAYSSVRSSAGLRTLVAAVRERGGEAFDMRVGNGPCAGDARAATLIARHARRRDVRLVHAHSSKAGALARLCALTPGFPPVLYTPHAYYGMAGQDGVKARFFNTIEAVLGRVGITHNCSQDERDFALATLRLPPELSLVIHHGIDTERFAPADEVARASARRALGLPLDGKLLVTIGRVSTQKNYVPLYAALADLLPQATWMFAHAGAGATELGRALPQGRHYAFEYLDDTSLLLRAADGFILTSRYEGLSISMLHALGIGLPLLLTEAPGFRMLRDLGFAAVRWLPDPTREPDLAAAIKVVLSDWAAEPRRCLSEQYLLARRLFDQHVQLEKLVSLARELALNCD
jgi:glycosyltransferase involved in cell wall biosynthesis